MARATWQGVTVAETTEPVHLEGNTYFPPESVDWTLLEESEARSICPWKGEVHYYDVVVGKARKPNTAWAYPRPWPAARKIESHVAFWNGVKVGPRPR